MLRKFLNSLTSGKESVEELYEEINSLNEECNSLNEVIKKQSEKINNLCKEIDKLKEELEDKDSHVKIDKNLLEKLEHELKSRDVKIKTLEEINKELNKNLLLQNFQKKNISEELFSFKLLISDYYGARKFESFRKVCEESSIFYVDDLEKMDFDSLALTNTKIKNAKNMYDEYKKGIYDLDIKTYLIKGDKISQVFFRFRSFVKYCNKNNYYYVLDLDKIDFNALLDNNFNSEQIEKIKLHLLEYNELKRIKN